jgi:predicted nucleotidyltransferase
LRKDISRYKTEESPDPKKSFFKLDFTNFTLDLLPQIQSDIRFLDANAKRDSVNVDNVEMHFISLEDLVEDKKSNGRKKDIEDIEELKKNNSKNE